MIELQETVVAQRILEQARLKANIEKGLAGIHDPQIDGTTIWEILSDVQFEYSETLGESSVICMYRYELSGDADLYVEIKSDFSDPNDVPSVFCFTE